MGESTTNAAEPLMSRMTLMTRLLILMLVLVPLVWNYVPLATDAECFQKSEILHRERDEIPKCGLEFMPKEGLDSANISRQVHLITYIGVEGTGHHLIQRILKSLVDTVFTSGNPKHRKFFGMMSTRFQKSTSGSPGEHVSSQLVQSLDTAAAEMDLVIDGSPDSSTFAFADWSNPFSGLFFSGVDPIDLVELTNRSRHNVSLSVIVLHRNWTKIIWSTALSRKFGSVARKVNELKASATVINAQLASVPLCSWRTFDIEDYPRHQNEYDAAFAKFLHVDVSAVQSVFKSSMNKFVEKDTIASGGEASKYDTLWTAEDLSYVHDAFDRSLVAPSWGRLTDSRYKLIAGFDDVGCKCSL